MGFLEWLLGGASEPAPRRANLQPIHLAPSAGFNVEIVGESYRQDALDRLCGGKCEEGHDRPATAQLCFVEDNPYDPSAVGVFIEGELVGFIARDLASKLREDILRLNPEERPVVCDALIVGGWDRGEGDEGHYGVKLSLAHPLALNDA